MLSLERQNEWRERYRRLNPGWVPATEQYARLVRERLQPMDRVLDLGCGRGGLAEQLAHPLQRLVGLDPDLASLRQHRLVALPRTAAASEHLPFAANSFDLIVASWVLEHLPQPASTFRQLGRVLRPNGGFVFITPNRRHPLAWLNLSFGRLDRWQAKLVRRLYARVGDDTFPTYYRANTEVALRHLCHNAGLTLVHLQAIADPSYLAFTPALFRIACRFEARLATARGIHLVGVLQRDS